MVSSVLFVAEVVCGEFSTVCCGSGVCGEFSTVCCESGVW